MKKNHLGLAILFLVLFPLAALGRPAYKIAFLSGVTEEEGHRQQVIRDINALLENRGRVEVVMKTIAPSQSRESLDAVSRLMADKTIDCIIGIGLGVSDVLIRLNRYDTPVVTAGIIDRKLQGLHMTAGGASGIPNFNYIQTPFDVERDLKTFKSLFDYTHLAVLLPAGETTMFHTIYSYFGHVLETVSPAAKLSMVEIGPGDIEKGIPQIPPGVDAVYLLPLFSDNNDARMKDVIRAINERKLPSFALAGEKFVRMGAMAAIAPDRNFKAVSRRVAMNVLDILEGRDAGKLPVSVSSYTDNFVVNIETLGKIDYYPGWDALDKAHLLNLGKLHRGPGLQLKEVINEALARNLDLLVEKAGTRIQEEEAGIARAALLPQVEVSAGVSRIDENRVRVAQTHPAQTTVSASGSVRQTVFQDDILANHDVQSILTDARRHQENALVLDTVVTVTQAYINLLFAMSDLTIRNNNLEVTRKNLEIARNKAGVGAVDASAVNRWESEKATNQISLNDAFRDLQLAKMNLNQILDRPITREFTVEDVGPETGVELLITDPRVYALLGNIEQVHKFSDFLIIEADLNLPELKQIKETLRSQERQVLNRRRAIYLPDVSFTGSADKILEEYDARVNTRSDLDHPWTLSLTASWPIFAGGAHKKDLARSRLELRRLRMEEKKLRNQLYFNVRSGLETAAVSAREIHLSQRGLAAALKNFEIVQAGYAEGRNSVTDLIDAQNAKLNSERAEASAKYQFVLDFLKLERAMGRFHFLDSAEGKLSFLTRLTTHMNTKNHPK